MCNLSQGIKEDGIAIGKEIGNEIGKEVGVVMTEARIIMSMHNKGFTVAQIAEVTDKNIAEIEAIIGGHVNCIIV